MIAPQRRAPAEPVSEHLYAQAASSCDCDRWQLADDCGNFFPLTVNSDRVRDVLMKIQVAKTQIDPQVTGNEEKELHDEQGDQLRLRIDGRRRCISGCGCVEKPSICFIGVSRILASTSIIDEPNWESKPSASASSVALTSLSHPILVLDEPLSQNCGPLQRFSVYFKAVCSRTLF